MKIRIASRRSNLSIKQVELVIKALKKIDPSIKTKIIFYKTEGDIHKNLHPIKIGRKGIFEREINQAVLRREADIAVHSLKDVPSKISAGLKLAATLPRESPFDALVSRNNLRLNELSYASIIGTSSIRRKAALLNLRSDIVIKSLRGNIETRLDKLRRKMYDAIMVSEAALKRLNLENMITQVFHPEIITPSPGQGIIGIYTRVDDKDVIKILSEINDKRTYIEAIIEREIMKRVGGGCFTPLGIYAKNIGKWIDIISSIYSPDGKKKVVIKDKGSLREIDSIVEKLSCKLLNRGAEIFTLIKGRRV